MDRIKVDTAKIQQQADSLQKIQNDLNYLSSRVNQISSGLRWNVAISSQVRNNLAQHTRAVQTLSSSANRMTDVLRTAVTQYQSTENKNAGLQNGSNSTTTSGGANGKGESSKSSWDDFVDSILGLYKGTQIGKFLSLIQQGRKIKSWEDLAKYGIGSVTFAREFGKTASNYWQIGHAVSGKVAASWWFKKVTGLRKMDWKYSKSTDPGFRFRQNMLYQNQSFSKTLSDKFGALAGKKGAKKALASWAGVAVSGVMNTFSNLKEQKETGMSNGRVVSETIMETAIDVVTGTVVSAGVSWGIGVAAGTVSAIIGAPVAVPALAVTAATAATWMGINALCKHLTGGENGKTLTEWASDKILDTKVGQSVVSVVDKGVNAIGNGVKAIGKSVGGWFKKAVFA